MIKDQNHHVSNQSIVQRILSPLLAFSDIFLPKSNVYSCLIGLSDGALHILSLLLVLLLLSWLIKYPDTIQGQVILTTTKAPVRLCGQIHGTLRNICVANGASVAQGELIAEITNPISEHALAYLQEFLHEVQTNIDKPRKRGIVFTAMPVQNYIFGDIQEEYNNLCGLCQNYDRLVQRTV